MNNGASKLKLEKFFSSTGFILLAVVFLALNAIAGLIFSTVRLDLTEQGLYSLSKGTKEIIDSIEEPVKLYFFFSDKATLDNAPLRSYAKRVRELLEEYEARGGDKLELKVIDPEPFSEAEEQAVQLGVKALQLKAGSESIYFGLVAIDTLDRHKTIATFDVSREQNLEYDISKLLSSLLNPRKPLVGLLSSLDLRNGGAVPLPNSAEAPWTILKFIGETLRIRHLDQDIWQIPDDLSVLMVVRPSHLSKQALYAVDQYVLGGGKALVFVDTFNDRAPQERILVNNASLLPRLLDSWGLAMEPYNVVGDSELAIQVQVNGVSQRHPAYMSLTRQVISEEDAVTALLDSINLGTAGHLEIKESATDNVQVLFSTSERGGDIRIQWLQSIQDAANLRRRMRREGSLTTIPLAVRVTGPATSNFAGPPELDSEEEGVDEEGLGIDSAPDDLPEHVDSSEEINVIVVADVDMLHDQYWVNAQRFLGQVFTRPVADNGSFVLNALENLGGSSALLSVRSRGRFSRPFEIVENIRQEADQRYRERSDALERRLKETEKQLRDLRTQQKEKGNKLRLRNEQSKAIASFNAERNAIRRQLREVRHQLNKDIDSLNTRIRSINIIVTPPLLVITIFLLWKGYATHLRRRRRLSL